MLLRFMRPLEHTHRPCVLLLCLQNGVQACIIRKHNARLTAVKKEDLAARHRQCIKPDQVGFVLVGAAAFCIACLGPPPGVKSSA